MKGLLALLVAFLASAPVAAQESRLYTNADLRPRPVQWIRTVTDAELASLKAREFVFIPPPRLEGPTVVILPKTPLFAPFAPTRPLSEPWSMTTYLGPHGRGFRSRPPSRGPGIHLQYP